jgi:acyl carrier protein phosphodiesterase
MRGMVPVIFETLLPAYGSAAGIGLALERMSHRIRRSNPLAEGAGELQRNRRGLRDDFREFMPQVQNDVSDFLVQNPLNHCI